MFEHEPGHHAKALEREVPARERELAPADVPPLGKPLLAELERAEHEQIGTLVEPLLTHTDSIHDAIAKG
jgi:hypothetical protein